MKICLIGKNLTNYVLAKSLSNKNLKVDIFCESKKEKKLSQRTLAISKENFDFLLKLNNGIKIPAWPVKNIKIYSDKNNLKELLEFKNEKRENFFLVKYVTILKIFEKLCKTSKSIKLKKFSYKSKSKNFILEKNYKLIINSYKKNIFNYKKIEKNYNSIAFTGILDHKIKKKNDVAIQIFTKYGPLAFLPLSETKTSIVFSVLNNFETSEKNIFNLIKKYNFTYVIKKINKFEKANIKFVMPRNYFHKNILFFGDKLHTVHPLAGQGFNMTIRDISILSYLIEEKIELGLELDKSLFHDFQKKTKHLNFTFGIGIDFIHEFFKLDNKTNNLLSSTIFSFFGKNKLLKKYFNLVADRGINI